MTPTMTRLLPSYKALATGFGYVALRDLLKHARRTREYEAIRAALEKEWVEADGRAGFYFTTTRFGEDIQIVVEEDRGCA